MSRFSSAFIVSTALAMFSLGAPLAFAQTAPHQSPAIAAHAAPAMQKAADTCFTQDLVPDDNSSMLTICGANAPSTVIFAQ